MTDEERQAALVEAASAAAWLIDHYNREMHDPAEVAQQVFETMREVMERVAQRRANGLEP